MGRHQGWSTSSLYELAQCYNNHRRVQSIDLGLATQCYTSPSAIATTRPYRRPFAITPGKPGSPLPTTPATCRSLPSAASWQGDALRRGGSALHFTLSHASGSYKTLRLANAGQRKPQSTVLCRKPGLSRRTPARAVPLHLVKLATEVPARKQRGRLSPRRPQSPDVPHSSHSHRGPPQPRVTSLAPTPKTGSRIPSRSQAVQRQGSTSYQTLRGTLNSDSSISLDDRAAPALDPQRTFPLIGAGVSPRHISRQATSLAPLSRPGFDQAGVASNSLTRTSDEIVDASTTASQRDPGVVSDIDSSTTTLGHANTAMRRQMSPLEPLHIPNLKNDVVVGDSEEEGESLIDTVSDASNIMKSDQQSYLHDKLHDSGTVDSETNVSTHDMSTLSPVRRSRTRSTFEGSSIGRLTNRGFEENENGFLLEVTAQSSKVAGRVKRTKSAPVRRASTSKRARTATEPVEDSHQDSDFSLDEADLLRTSKPLGSTTTDRPAIDTTVSTGLDNLCTARVPSRALGELNSQDMRKPTKRSNKVSSGSSLKGGTKRANERGPSTRTSSPMELLPISSPPVDEALSLLPPQIDPQHAALRVQAEPVTKQAEINAKPLRGLAGILTRKGIAGVRHPGLSKAAKVPRLHANLKPPPPPKAAIPKPREKKKKGDESYSDEEKPWWETKHPEEWTDEDFERYRRVTERRERGLDSD